MSARTNLGPSRSSFVGRAGELERLGAAIERGRPLVTLTGPAGVGKSRLAEEAARRQARRFEGGVWACDLTRAASAGELARLVLETLGEPHGAGGSDDAVADLLTRRAPTLLLVDNVEHLVDDGARAISRWIAAAPAHCVLATSQVPLGLPIEHVHRVEPLAHDDALALFATRYRDASPLAELDDDELRTLGQIAEHLDRLPLAIELAAARAPIMSPAEMLARVADRFGLLRARGAGGVPRHATLEASIAWSFELLQPPMQQALAALAVFEGAFDVEAAEHVLPPDCATALDRVQTLVERSLVVCERPQRQTRLRLLQSIRAFLLARAELGVARARHEAFYLRRHAPEAPAPLARVAEDAAQLRAIVARADPPAAARAALALAAWLRVSATREEHVAMLERGLASAHAAGDAFVEALLCLALAKACAIADPDGARAHIDRTAGNDHPLVDVERRSARGFVLCHAGRLDDAIAELLPATTRTEGARAARIHQELAVLYMLGGRTSDARSSYRTAIEGFRTVGNLQAAAAVAGQLGALELDWDDDAARELLEAALSAHRVAGERRLEAMVASNVAVLEHQTGRLDASEARWTESLAVHRQVGNRRFEAFALAGLGAVLHERGELPEAFALVDRSCEIFATLHDPRWEGWARSRRGAVRSAMGDAQRAGADFAAARALLAAAGGHPWLGAVDILERGVADMPSDRPRNSAERLAARLVGARVRQPSAPADRALVIAQDGAWFAIDGARVSLARRHAMRRLLAGLAAHRRASPGLALHTSELVAAAWPGERMRDDSGAARVYTAVRTLRRMGLDGVLVSAAGGYLLHPSVDLAVSTAEPVADPHAEDPGGPRTESD